MTGGGLASRDNTLTRCRFSRRTRILRRSGGWQRTARSHQRGVPHTVASTVALGQWRDRPSGQGVIAPRRVTGGSGMSTEQNKAVVRRFMTETLVGGNVDVIDELLAPNYVNRAMAGMDRRGLQRGAGCDGCGHSPVVSSRSTIWSPKGMPSSHASRGRTHSPVGRRSRAGVSPTTGSPTARSQKTTRSPRRT